MVAYSKADESHHFSWLPYDKCHHFVCRQLYEERLEKAFIEDAQSGKIFVLWGLGGVGLVPQLFAKTKRLLTGI